MPTLVYRTEHWPHPRGRRASRRSGHKGELLDVDRFIATNQPVWDRLGALTARAGRGVGRLSASELDELVRLYQRVSSHLSYARTYYRDPSLTAALTRLVARAGAAVYGTRSRSLKGLFEFLATTFPAAVWHCRRSVAASTVLLFLPALVFALWIANSPAALDASAPAAVRQAYIERDFGEYYSSGPAAAFSSRVFTNNVQVAAMAFAGGIGFCVLTAFVLAFNGANLGVVAGMFAAAGKSSFFWGLILPHGLLELTAVCIAGAAGLRLGWTLIDPGDRPRAVALVEEGRRAVVIVIGLIGAFAAAAVIEGFVTGSRLPTGLRVGLGVTVEASFIAYLVVQGRGAARRGFTGALGEGEPGWTAPPAHDVAAPEDVNTG